MLTINQSITIPDEELVFTFSRSSGPGGQNVNKVNSKATLRWEVVKSRALPEAVKIRFCQQQAHRINQLGHLVISSQRNREQLRNSQDCLEKLRGMIEEALRPPKIRKATRIPRGVNQRRLKNKKQRSEKKQSRRSPRMDD